MKFVKFQRWVVIKIMDSAEIWNGMFTHEVNRRAIEAFKKEFPTNEDTDFSAKKIEEMKTFYRSGMHVMISVWLTAASLFISVLALLISIIALITTIFAK